MLDRIQLRAIGRLRYESYIFWYFGVPGHVPSGSVNQHHYEKPLKSSASNSPRKQTHHLGVCVGQYQGGHFTQSRAHSGIHIYGPVRPVWELSVLYL